MLPAHAPRRHALARRIGLWWLLLALVLAPALAGMHRVLHLPTAPAGSVQQHGGAHGLGALFAGHSASDCQLLNQLAHGSAPGASWALPVTAALPAYPAAAPVQAALPRAPLPFLARAPPLA
ncbi:hypothetical protein [Comamonas flocculans]|uniref:Uncharacterized protein n=1 Tax=Comamonas flocculans TaxID=2597701 RepID=A0A5B8RXE9_9BURK|nr:hypothetical protein [Comamonas flocculans]QEA13404.1 hypothetical protein FOZ74_10390 [Comamonas flocculans]